jgi:poly(3-hydroxybutyrate) depolymerase
MTPSVTAQLLDDLAPESLSCRLPLQVEPAPGEPMPLPRGRVVLRTVPGRTGGKVYAYVPARWRAGMPIVAAVHGISRNAREQAALFAPLAEEYGFALIAPLFCRERYRDFQRLGLEGRGRRADTFFGEAVDQFCQWLDVATQRVHVVGYSGGAQFAHRYALFHPERLHGVVLGAAGWYTLPDAKHAYPLGLADLPAGLPVSLDSWLALPMLVLVGSEDTERDGALRTGAALDRQQGRNRLERGLRFANAMRQAAQRRNLPARTEFRVLDGVPHSFEIAMRRGDLGRVALQFFGMAAAGAASDAGADR